MKRLKHLNEQRLRRKARSRARIYGTAERPRISVFRSNKYLYAQLVDDDAGKTLASASTREERTVKQAKVLRARALGERLAEAAKNIGVTRAVFHRGAYRFHGQVQALVEGAREKGLHI